MTRDEITEKVTELYVGILGRAADYAGLQYWVDQIEAATLSLENTRASFATQDQSEYWTIYGGLTNGALVDTIYSNYLERAPDTEGRAYWVGELDAGSINPDQMINAIINAVQDPEASAEQTLIDAQVLSNKVAAAIYFTTQTESVDATTDGFIQQAQSIVADVNEDAASVTAANSISDSYAESAVEPSPANSLIGTWNLSDPGDPDDDMTFTFNSDGTYTQWETGGSSVTDGPTLITDSDNPTGYQGTETGTYTWDEDSGTLTVLDIISDNNGDWGLSDDAGGGTLHIDIVGEVMTIPAGGLVFMMG